MLRNLGFIENIIYLKSMQDMFVTDWGKERIIVSYAKISVFLIIEISQK